MNIDYKPIVNKIASTTLGIYLLHDGPLANWLWREVFNIASFQSSPELVFRIIGAAIAVFAVGVTVDLIRQLIEKYTLSKILNCLKADSKI